MYDDLPAAGTHPGKLSDPLDFESIIKAGFGKHLGFEHQFDQQPTMFQPVGGIDGIAKAFEKRVGDRIPLPHGGAAKSAAPRTAGCGSSSRT